MDTAGDPDIRFDEQGVCNYCHQCEAHARNYKFPALPKGFDSLDQLVSTIKAGKKGKYDSVLGVSGGVDSTYAALKAKELGLSPLILHLDNGWDSETATRNIENIVTRLGFDLYTHVIDWPEFRDLQLSFIKAHVVDIEALTDHAILALQVQMARRIRVKYILTGTNHATESILPPTWAYKDPFNIRDIHRQFGTVPLRTFPIIDFHKLALMRKFNMVRFIDILDMVPYVKADAKKEIIEKLGWKDYGGKHYESIFTRFYQGYILPHKFGIDKRKAHLSSLISSGQLSREAALEEMKLPMYDPEQFRQDFPFVLKKLGLSEAAFQEYLATPPRKHTEFASTPSFFDRYPFLRPLKFLSR